MFFKESHKSNVEKNTIFCLQNSNPSQATNKIYYCKFKRSGYLRLMDSCVRINHSLKCSVMLMVDPNVVGIMRKKFLHFHWLLLRAQRQDKRRRRSARIKNPHFGRVPNPQIQDDSQNGDFFFEHLIKKKLKNIKQTSKRANP